MSTSDDSARALQEILRESERAVDGSLRALEEFDDKVEQMLTLAVAVLGGGLAIAGFTVSRPTSTSLSALVALSCGVTLSLGAGASFLSAYLRPADGGFASGTPHPRWLAERARSEDLDLAEHLVAVILTLSVAFETNVSMVVRGSKALRLGVRALLAAVAAFAGAVMFLVGGAQ